MNKRTVITALLALAVTMFAQAQNLIKNATAPVSFSKSDFADTIKIRVMDGAVVIPVEIAGKTMLTKCQTLCEQTLCEHLMQFD